jgi:hypothetical protein
VPAEQRTVTFDVAVSVPTTVESVPKFIAVALIKQALAIVTVVGIAADLLAAIAAGPVSPNALSTANRNNGLTKWFKRPSSSLHN